MATPEAGIPAYLVDDLIVDRRNFCLHKGDEVKALTPRAFDVLVYLIENRGRVVEKGELFEQIWGETFVTDNALTRTVKEIRRATGDEAGSPRYIETIPKRGYRFIADVTVAPEAVAASVPLSAPSRKAAEPLGPVAAAPSGLKISKTGLLAVIVLSGLIATAGFLIWNTRSTSRPIEPTVLRTVQVTNWPGVDLYPALSPDGNSIAYCSDHSGDFEIYVKQLTPGAREIQITSDGQQNFQPAWSPDGSVIGYYSKNRGGIWVVPSSGGNAKQLTDFGSRPSWSPDGSSMVFESYPLTDVSATSVGAMPPSTLWVVQAQGGDPAQITQVGVPSGGHGSASWSHDGNSLVFISYNGAQTEIWRVSRAGDDLKLLVRSKSWLYDPILSPDDRYIYYGGISQSGNFVLYKAALSPTGSEVTGEPAEVTNTGLVLIKHLTISADGKRMAYSGLSMKGNISSVPLLLDSSESSGAPVALTQDTSYRKGLPVISPDGRKISFVEFRGGTNQDIWAIDVDGKNAIQLTTDPATDWAPSWAPDGEHVAFQSHRNRSPTLWTVSVRTGREKLLVDPGQDVGWPKLSPDGKRVAFNSTRSGTINVWTMPVGGGDPKQLTFADEQMGWPCWSPDGKLLAFQMRRGDDTHVAVIPADGGEIAQLTHDPGQSWVGSWSPDGDKITFAGFRNGHWNIWWVSRRTKQQKKVTNYSALNAFVRYPSWSPLGNQIVYEYAETTGNIWLMELK
jgi:Tol biopolymer transport system component/DNA-binding winged helix-turn-helix (wHTH) protein